MVDEAKVRAALEQAADAVELPGRVWEKVRGVRPGRPGLWGRIRFGRVVEAVAVCAVLAGLVAMGAYRANHAQQAPAGKHEAAVTLPAALTVKEIQLAEVRSLSADPQSAVLRPEYLVKIVNVYNQASKQVRPRTVTANPDYSIVLHLTSGKVLSLGIAKGQSLMADYDGAAFWLDSRDVADVLNGADTLLPRADVPHSFTPLIEPTVLEKVTSVEIRRMMGAQKTTSDPAQIDRVKAVLAKATLAANDNGKGQAESFSVILHPASGDPIPLAYSANAYAPYVRNEGQVTWWTAPGLDEALKPLLPPPSLTSEQVVAIARKSDPGVEWYPRYEAKGSLVVDGDVLWAAVGLNSRDERVALYLDPVNGKILRTDPPEAPGAKAVAAVTQFYALTARGEYNAVWALLHASARHPNPSLTPLIIQQRLAAMQGKPGPTLLSATADKMSLDYAKYVNCMCQIADSVQVIAKLSDGSEEKLMVAREADGVWRLLWAPH